MSGSLLKQWKKFKRLTRRSYFLLEIMIALTLIVLCALPLISPHTAMMKEQQQFIEQIKQEQLVRYLYSDIMERLYRSEIPWKDIEEQKTNAIDQALLDRAGWKEKWSGQGFYKISSSKFKANREKGLSIHMLQVIFVFSTPKSEKKKQYVFPLVVGHIFPPIVEDKKSKVK